MSRARIDALINLIRAANDTYLINPTRNARTAYILIDNLCELAIKTYLQAKTKERQDACLADLEALNIVTSNGQHNKLREYYAGTRIQADLEQDLGATGGQRQIDLRNVLQAHRPLLDWTPEREGGGFKLFAQIVQEVKDLNPLTSNSVLHDLLDRFSTRRGKRNDFFHDPNLAGWAASEEECLQAFWDLYDLMGVLFGADYRDCLAARQIARTQIAVIRLGFKGYSVQRVYDHHQTVVRSMGSITLPPGSLGHEYLVIYDDPQGFYDGICRYFDGLIASNQAEIDRIDALQRRNQNHREKRERLEEENNKLRAVVAACLS